MATLRAAIDKRALDCLIILGDLTEEKDKHPAALVNMIVDHLDRFAAMVPTLVMMGNHDYHNEGHPFFAFLDRIPNLYWIDKPTFGHELKNPLLARMFDNDVFLPHTRNYQTDWDAFSNFDRVQRVFAHQTFTGAATAQGHRLDGIPLDYFPDHVDIIAGDIHVPQRLGNLEYIGAPYRVDFGDTYRPHALILNNKNDNCEALDLGLYPQKVMIEVNDVADLERNKLHKQVMEGDVIKMRIGIDDMGQWHDAHTFARKWIVDCGAIPYRIEPVMEKRGAPRLKIRTDTSVASEEDVLTSYANQNKISTDLLDEGLDIIKNGADAVRGMK